MAKRFNVSKALQEARGAADQAGGGQAVADPAEPAPAPQQRTAPAEEKTAPAKQPAAKVATSKPAQTSTRTRLSAVPDKDETEVDQQLLHSHAEPAKLTRRVHVPLPENQFRYLKRANAEDDIDTTVRIRAMVELYEQDARLRARVDKLAKLRNDDLIRHRWQQS